MKGKYILCSFLAVILALGAYYIGYRYVIMQNNDEKSIKNQKALTDDIADDKLEDLLQVDTNNEKKTTNTTKYILEYYNSKDFTLREENLPMPAEYVGLSRTQLIDKISEYEKNPNSNDIQQGFVKFELVSFSPDNVVLRKTYNPYQEKNEYIIKANGIYVSVYYYETNELYENTTIRLDNLPGNIEKKILSGDYVTNIQGLYNFLENYSS